MSGYDAFISYSHRADDFRAAALQRALQGLGRPFYRRRALDVFRDETSLSANPALWPSIERALAKSRFFVLMASPESCTSPWCTREIEWWLANRSTDTFLIVLTSGDFASAISSELRGKFPVEPFYCDLRWTQRGDNLTLTNPRFRSEVLPLAAALHGIEPQELDGEDLRQFRRTRLFWRSAAVALSILTIISAGAAWIATKQSREATRQRRAALDATVVARHQRDAAVRAQKAEELARNAEKNARIAEEKQRVAAEASERVAVAQRDEAVRQRNLAFARQLAIKAEFLQKDKPGLLPQSMLVAAESLRRAPSLEADRTLRYGLELLPRQISELRFQPYEDSQGFTAVADDRVAFFTVPTVELQVVQVTQDGFRPLGKWQPQKRPRMVSFDRTGRYLVIAEDGGIWLWNLEQPAPARVSGCEGELAAIGGFEHPTVACVDQTVKIIDVATGAMTEHAVPDVTGLAFDGTGKRLAMARADGSLFVAEIAPWKELLRTDREYDGGIYAATVVAFSPDDSLVVKATGRDKVLHVREVDTGKEVATLNHPDLVLAVAFNESSRYIATACADGVARVFDSHTGALVDELRHFGAVRDVRFAQQSWTSDSPLLLATASEDGTARLWRVYGGQEIARATSAVPIGRVIPHFGRADRFATLSYDGTMRLWDGDLAKELDGEKINAAPLAATWLPRQGAFGLAYSHLTWRIDPQRKQRRNFGDFKNSTTAVWSVDAARVLVGGRERVQVWDAVAGKTIAEVSHPYASGWALSADGNTFAIAIDRAVKVYRVAREAPIAVMLASFGTEALALSASHLAIADQSSIVITPIAEPNAKPMTIDVRNFGKLAFSADGRFLTWEHYDFSVYDMHTGRRLPLLDLHGEHTSAKVFAFSPDGRRIAGASEEDFGIWSLPDGKPILIGTYEGKIASIALSGDGRLVAIGGKDGMASVRQIAGGAELVRVTMPPPDPGQDPAPIQAVALSDRGDYLLTASARANRIWPIAVESLLAEACRRLQRGLTREEWNEYVGSESYRATCVAH